MHPLRFVYLIRRTRLHKSERGYSSVNQMSIVDLYFYEELSSVAGNEIGSQWLKKTVGNSLRRRKSGFARFGSSFGRLSRGSSLSSLSESSCPSSPRSCASTTESPMFNDKPSSGSAAPEDEVFAITSSCSKTNFSNDSYDQAEEFRNAFSSPSHFSSEQTGASTEGLIFTDAAHMVLD
jgi:hypothetical protein